MIINIDNGIIDVSIEEPTPERVDLYLRELKEKLGVGWIGLCPVFGLKATRGNSNNLFNWRNGKQNIPFGSWILLLRLVKNDEIVINES